MIMRDQDVRLLWDMQHQLYPPECELVRDDAMGVGFELLESTVHIPPPEQGNSTVVFRNKNEAALILDGKQRYLRYPHWKAYTPKQVKRALVVGTVHRMVANTSANAYGQLWKPLWLLFAELILLDYPWSHLYWLCKRIPMGKLCG